MRERAFFVDTAETLWCHDDEPAIVDPESFYILIPSLLRLRTHRGLPDRLPRLPPLHRHRHHRLEHPPRHGHDDGLARHHLPPVQAAPLRHGRRLDTPHPRPCSGVSAVSPAQILDYARMCLLIVLRLSLIPIIVATVVGLLVSLLQALTQIQEQTLGFAVKLIAISLTLLVCASWLGKLPQNFTLNLTAREGRIRATSPGKVIPCPCPSSSLFRICGTTTRFFATSGRGSRCF